MTRRILLMQSRNSSVNSIPDKFFEMERQYEEFQIALKAWQMKLAYPWKFIVKKLKARAFLAEFLGTFILCVSLYMSYLIEL